MIMNELLTIKEASILITKFLGKNITPANISYLIQYGKVKKLVENGITQILKKDLISYFEENYKKKANWEKQLGKELNWALSFEQYKESETTKHVHRLHPYKGKFIPQLVEYFLDNHVDKFKEEVYFNAGDIILDPFCGSGTTLVQCSELSMHAIGIDISEFNALISNAKLERYDFEDLSRELKCITLNLETFAKKSSYSLFEKELLEKLNVFNAKFFPSPEYKYQLKNGRVDEFNYSKPKEMEFLKIYKALQEKYNIDLNVDCSGSGGFLKMWYLRNIRNEIDVITQHIHAIKNLNTKKIISIILSRTVRSCRATTHSDLATLKSPVTTTYYCSKHGKICKPLFSLVNWWKRYSLDTINRLKCFESKRTDTKQICLFGDARKIPLIMQLNKIDANVAKMVKEKKIKGIFTSPPYVGLIDYHEQHAYAYELFGLPRHDDFEIGSLHSGQGKLAKESYTNDIAHVLQNCKRYLADGYHVFLVANDKYNLYPEIAKLAGMKIIKRYERPVLNRTEKDKSAYSETIFYLREDK